MSIIEELGAQVRAASDELPVGLLAKALEQLQRAAERLRWVRQESANPMGVPELSAATEHAESAAHTLRVAQEQLTTYLAAIGLGRDGGPAPPPQRQPVLDRPIGDQPAVEPEPVDVAPVRRWWSVRVAELTGGRDAPGGEPDRSVADPRELLDRVATTIRSDDRGRLHTELRRVDANVGLGLAAVSPPVLRQLAEELLGHPPRAADLPRLRDELGGRVRDLLPGLPPAVLETLLTRICRMPPPKEPARPEEQPHPADPAVAAAVATGVLMRRLGHDRRPQRQEPSAAGGGPDGERSGGGGRAGDDRPGGEQPGGGRRATGDRPVSGERPAAGDRLSGIGKPPGLDRRPWSGRPTVPTGTGRRAEPGGRRDSHG